MALVKKRKSGKGWLIAFVLLLAAIGGGYWFFHSFNRPITIDGQTVYVNYGGYLDKTAKVRGVLSRLYCDYRAQGFNAKDADNRLNDIAWELKNLELSPEQKRLPSWLFLEKAIDETRQGYFEFAVIDVQLMETCIAAQDEVSYPMPCPYCGGAGKLPCKLKSMIDSGYWGCYEKDTPDPQCSLCKGTGKIDCCVCRGKGQVFYSLAKD